MRSAKLLRNEYASVGQQEVLATSESWPEELAEE